MTAEIVSAAADRSTQRPWTLSSARALYELPFNELLYRSHCIHRANFDPNEIQLSKLLNIKTGGCPEDCGYCSQSVHAQGIAASKLMKLDEVMRQAVNAKEGGATRYCLGAAWRSPKGRDEAAIVAMIKGVKSLGLETCMTLGMISQEQAAVFAEAGLDYYNHNLDTSERFYPNVVTTRKFSDRLATLSHVREAGMKVCSGGILGMGETIDDRIDMLVTLANLAEPPESVPINLLIPMPGTKMADVAPVDPIEFVRVIALARVMMPTSFVRLTAGRTAMSDEMQALCFFAGANSMFIGDMLLTASNPGNDRDHSLLTRLRMTASGKGDLV
ncbi:biotin synthase BioB [Allorhizobium sp. NPDC080224]|uniref:biotin synthase BioB n=1 Tax=Allorhizobium sp. NPDC080224 TaxID=3390547 RepID=UPI003CFE38C4